MRKECARSSWSRQVIMLRRDYDQVAWLFLRQEGRYQRWNPAEKTFTPPRLSRDRPRAGFTTEPHDHSCFARPRYSAALHRTSEVCLGGLSWLRVRDTEARIP